MQEGYSLENTAEGESFSKPKRQISTIEPLGACSFSKKILDFYITSCYTWVTNKERNHMEVYVIIGTIWAVMLVINES